jgi:hypothetical protein
VRQTTNRVPLHIAEILKMSIDEGAREPVSNFPESRYVTNNARPLFD